MYSKLSQTTISRAQGAMTSTDRRTPAGGAAGVAHEVAFTTADNFQRCSMSSAGADRRVVVNRNSLKPPADASSIRLERRSDRAAPRPLLGARARRPAAPRARPSPRARCRSVRGGPPSRTRSRSSSASPPLSRRRARLGDPSIPALTRPSRPSPASPPRHLPRVAQEGAEAEREDLHRRLEGPREARCEVQGAARAPQDARGGGGERARGASRLISIAPARRVAPNRPRGSPSSRGSTPRLLPRPRRAPVPDPPFSRPPFPSCPSPSFSSARSASASRNPWRPRRRIGARRWRRTC